MKKQLILIIAAFITLNVSSQKFENLAPTPPMGWNSWDCFGMDGTEDQIKATADYMAKYMKSAGWEYIIVDMGWNFGEGNNTWNCYFRDTPPQFTDKYGRTMPNTRKFPSSKADKGFKKLADYVHSKGLKFGIHIMRGIPWEAYEKNTPIKGTNFRAKDIAVKRAACNWYRGMYLIDMTKSGAQEYYNSLVELYKEWGVDYIKADNMQYESLQDVVPDVEALRKAIDQSGRPIVLSLVGWASVEKVDKLRQNANLWRITGDMWDDWSFIKEAFRVCRHWQGSITPNHWPDCDILPLGKLRINGTDENLARAINLYYMQTLNEYSRLSTDEKYTLLSLWYIFRSPLMMGGNLMENDQLTLQLLTNTEALAVNQNSSKNHELRATDSEIVWVADDPTSGGKYVAIFNISDKTSSQISVTWEELGIKGGNTVRDLWQKKDIGKFDGSFEATINPHGCGLYKISSLTNE
jgi:alpha-galactosidase